MHGAADDGDSVIHGFGAIPGLPGRPAFTLVRPQPSEIPVLISVPHAGRAYPPAVLRAMREPGPTALKLEDRFVDVIAQRVAELTGAALLMAQAPRAMIDLNRALDDVDWEMFAKPERPPSGGQACSVRARSGLGLIPRRLPMLGEIWRQGLKARDLDDRVASIHAPYHETLGNVLADLRSRWGAALLIDLHSMPPIPPRAGLGSPQFVLGDRFGASCGGQLVASAFAHFAAAGREVGHNRPYAGGYVLARHGCPRGGLHALQLEVDRSCYLDSRLEQPVEPLVDAMADVLAGLVRRLACEAAELDQADRSRAKIWSQAAE